MIGVRQIEKVFFSWSTHAVFSKTKNEHVFSLPTIMRFNSLHVSLNSGSSGSIGMHVGCSSSGWRSSAAKSLLGLRLSAACFSPLRSSARAGLSSEYVCCSDLKAEAMTGSSSSSSKEPLLEKAFSVAPCNLVRKVQILLDGRRAYAAPSGAWKRKQESILKPARDCYETLSLESIEGDDAVRFSCGHLVRILNYIALACDWYWQRLQSISHEKVGLVLFGDEATGGNVLQLLQRRCFSFTWSWFNWVKRIVLMHGCLLPRFLTVTSVESKAA